MSIKIIKLKRITEENKMAQTKKGKVVDSKITVICENCGDIHEVYITDDDIEFGEAYYFCDNCDCEYTICLEDDNGEITYEICFD